MAKSYRLTPLAEADLEEIWFYTFRHWSIEQADSYHRSLVAVFEGWQQVQSKAALLFCRTSINTYVVRM